MKKKLKPVLFIVLVIAFVILAILPAPVSSTMYPGFSINGDYGPTCACPIAFFNCICNVFPN